MSPRTSEILSSLAAHASDRLTVGDILSVLRGRAFALLIVLLGLPNCLPMPPPIPLVCGLLLALVAAQIAAGWGKPWLPGVLLRRSVSRAEVSSAVARALPALIRLERWSRPRVEVLHTALAMRILGFVLLALALGLVVAAPVVGQIPLGLAVCLLGLGLVERDGVVLIAGLAIGSIGIAVNVGFVYAVATALASILE